LEPYWDDAKYVLQTLLLKVRGLDENGLDLVFTKASIEAINEKDMHRIMEKMNHHEARPRKEVHGNIVERLVEILDDYKTDITKKRRMFHKVRNMTVIVLTTGIWDETREEVGKVIISFIQDFKRIMDQAYMGPQFSIEFVQFGNDPIATEVLQYLDDDLEGIPYVRTLLIFSCY